DSAGPRYELSQGELIVSAATSFSHNEIRDRLNARLRSFVEPRRLGLVAGLTEFQIGPSTVRRPEVAFVQAVRWRREYASQVPVPIAPDLCFDVVAPHERTGALMIKIGQYLAAGTQAVWLIYPERQEALRYSEDWLQPEARQEIEEPRLLPLFTLPLREILPAIAEPSRAG
ncbi:MAG: Uma2 family endonuclease, partial [Terriglobales bacterium]